MLKANMSLYYKNGWTKIMKEKIKNSINNIIDIILCRASKETFYKYEKILLFLSLFILMFYYMVIFRFNDLGLVATFSWLLYPFFIALYIPLIHSAFYHIKNKEFKIKLIDIAFVIYIMFCIIATIFSETPYNSIFGNGIRNEGIFTIIFYFLVYLLGRNIVSKDNILELINFIFIFGIVQVIAGLFQSYYTWNSYFDEMAYGYASNPNMFGLLMGMLLTIAVGLYFNENEHINKYKYFYLVCIILFYTGLVLAESAGPFFSFIGMLGIMFIYYIIKKVKVKKMLLILLIFIVLFPIIEFTNRAANEYYLRDAEYKTYITNNNTDYSKLYTDVITIINKIIPKKNTETEENTSNTQNDDTKRTIDNGRIAEWKLVIKEVKKNWKNGVGLDCLNIYYNGRGYWEILDKAHNQYLDILVSIGVFGCITYLTMMIIVTLKGIKNKNAISKTIFFGFLYYSIAIFVNISTPFVAIYYYIIVGLIIGLCEK